MPYNIAACDSSKHNYAAGRMDGQTYGGSVKNRRKQCVRVVVEPVYRAFWDEASLRPGLIPDGLPPIHFWPRTWHFDGRQHVDPTKEATAEETRLKNKTTTLRDVYASQGKDWEEAIRQRAREIALERKLGILSAETIAAAVPAGGPPDDDEEVPADE